MGEGQNYSYLLTGLLIGLVAGIFYAWVIDPISYYDTAPCTLRAEFKTQYRSLIAQAYQANGDLGRVHERLALLKDEDLEWLLSAQAQRILANGGSPDEARALALLATDLEMHPLATQDENQEDSTQINNQLEKTKEPASTSNPIEDVSSGTQFPLLTMTPVITFTPRSTPRTEPTLGSPFALRDRQIVCDPSLLHGLLQIEVLGNEGEPVPGVQVDIMWNDGEDTFYTGLYPQISLGYADFSMTPDTIYSIRVGEGGEITSDIAVSECEDADGFPYWGGWWLRFSQP